MNFPTDIPGLDPDTIARAAKDLDEGKGVKLKDLVKKNKRVLVTGATGFLGSHLMEILPKYGYQATVFDYEMLNYENILSFFEQHDKFNYAIHCAGYNGGIEFNRQKPFDIFYQNTVIGLNLLNACVGRVDKVVSIVASCAYPFAEPVEDADAFVYRTKEIMKEHCFLDDNPHPSVACHGYAKRNLQLASYYAKTQHNLNAICVCPTTLYGKGDSFLPEKTKVMGAMVKRFVDAVHNKDKEVVIWGSGKPLREFLYVEDAANLIVLAMEKYNDSQYPLNLGSGQEMSIRALAEMMAALTGFDGKIAFDISREDGQYRKRLDLTKMHEVLFGDCEYEMGGCGYGYTPLSVGIKRTIDYYRVKTYGS